MVKKRSTSQDVENYKHDAAKRTMIPTAEQQGFVEEDEARPIKLRYPRNTDLDPQLVWRGKDAEDATDLYVDAPPVYIQEKIHPRAIIERLKRDTARRREAEAEIPDLFADFNGRPEELEARTEFYQHEQNWQNRMILGDALMVMASLSERENLRGKVQCIYMDPPYGIKFNSNWQPTTTSRDVKDSSDFVSREPEVIRAFRDTWKDGVNTYLSYLRDRLSIARDLLSDSGSIFVQIGDENVHRIRALMDEVFGERNFISEIKFNTTGLQSGKFLSSAIDHLVWYGKDTSQTKYRQLYRAKVPGEEGATGYTLVEDAFGFVRSMTTAERDDPKAAMKTLKVLDGTPLKSSGASDDKAHFNAFGYPYPLTPNSHWKTHPEGRQNLLRAGRVLEIGNRIEYRMYLKDFGQTSIDNYWQSGGQRGFTGEKVYVVQTAPDVVQRAILMTTDPGDLVLDPTCGSGTTAFVAEHWGRRWITIDTSRVALTLARARIVGTCYPYFLLRDTEAGLEKEAEITGIPPQTDRLSEVRRDKYAPDLSLGFVYRRVPHIQLRDVANNSQIGELWNEFHPAVEEALESLNDSLKGQPEPFPVSAGGRSGGMIDFTATGEVTMPSGEPAPKSGFMEWEVPRDPGTPWPEDQQKLYDLAKTWDADATPAKRRKAEDALADLNKARGESWTFDTLPERPVTVLRQSFPDILGRFVTEALVRFLFKFRRPPPGAATGVFGLSAS